MSLTDTQQRAIADLEAWGIRLWTGGSAIQAGNDYGGLYARMQDLVVTEIPLEQLRQTIDAPPPHVVAGPGTTVTVQLTMSRATVTVQDRTKWTLSGVEVEIWSQALGKTGLLGVWSSPSITPGKYPLKVRAPFVGAASGGPDDEVKPGEVANDTEFPNAPIAVTVTVGLAAGNMSTIDRTAQIVLRAAAAAPNELKEQLKQLVSPMSLGILAGLAGLWAAGQFFGVGEIADAIAFVSLLVEVGFDLLLAKAIAEDLGAAIWAIAQAKNEFQMQKGGEAFARVAAVVGIGKLMDACAKLVKKKTAPAGEYRPDGSPPEKTTVPKDEETPPGPGKPTPLAQKLGDIMGKDVYDQRAAGVDQAIANDASLARARKEDLVALRGYTSDAETAVGREFGAAHPDIKPPPGHTVPPDYSVFNAACRRKFAGDFAKISEYFDAALRAFDSLPAKKGRSIRGVDRIAAIEAKLKPGHVFQDDGFFSTSVSNDVAANFGVGGGPKIRMVIQGYAGRSVSAVSELPQEAEILYRPGTRFIVTSVKNVGEHLVVTLFELRPHLDDFVSVWGRGNMFFGYLRSLREAQPAGASK